MRDGFDQVGDALRDAQHCYEAWWLLEGAHNQRAQVIEAFKELPLIYETLRPALYTSLIIKVCSVFGTGADDITLRSMPGSTLDFDFSRVWEIGRRLYKLRSKLIAHLDRRCDPDLIARETGLTYDGLRDFISDALALYNRLAELHHKAGVPNFEICEELSVFLTRLNQKDEEAESGPGE